MRRRPACRGRVSTRQGRPGASQFFNITFGTLILIVLVLVIDIARGSALESAAALDVLVAKKRSAQEEIVAGKDGLWSIVSMRVGLLRSNSDYRLHEDHLDYEYEYE